MVLLQAKEVIVPDSASVSPLRSALDPFISTLLKAPSFLYTLYLFTKNDFLTFAIPTTLFAVFGALSGSVLTTNSLPSAANIVLRIPVALLVVWSNLLIFDISNQRSLSAVEEDKINKPHRPLPSGRITTEASRRLLLVVVPSVLVLGWLLGCWQETLLIFTMTWMYNDLGGSDEDWILRNFLIASGYGFFSSAALRVMVGRGHGLTTKGVQWVALITLIMFITQHICDIKDTEGDRIRGRRSAPIVLGDNIVRWSVAIPVMACSVACPAFFGLGITSYLCILAMGSLVAIRTLLFRTLKSDKSTWKLWALWTCCLFALPLVKEPAVLVQAWTGLKNAFCDGGDCPASLKLAAVSGITLVVQGKRLYGHAISSMESNRTLSIPRIVIKSAVSSEP